MVTCYNLSVGSFSKVLGKMYGLMYDEAVFGVYVCAKHDRKVT